MKHLAITVIAAILSPLLASAVATQFIARVFYCWSTLGPSVVGDTAAPFTRLGRCCARYPRPFAVVQLLILAGLTGSVLVLVIAAPRRLALKPFAANDDAARRIGIEQPGVRADVLFVAPDPNQVDVFSALQASHGDAGEAARSDHDDSEFP